MPISVQLPGYQHATAPALADLISAGTNIYGQMKKGRLEDAQLESENLKNQAAQKQAQIQADLSNPDTPQSQAQVQKLAATAQTHINLGKKVGLSDQDLSPLAELVNYAKNGQTVEGQRPDGAEGPGLPVTKRMSGLEAIQVTDSPLLKSIDSYIKGAQAAQSRVDVGQQRNEMMGKSMNFRYGETSPIMDQRNERLHNSNVTSLNNNSTVIKLTQSADNLNNAMRNFQEGGATPQEFGELQQAVRANTGVKGAGGVSERQETYLKSLGINKDKFMQFITGDPQSVMASDPAFAKQIMGVANLELQNKQAQLNKQVDQLSQGHQSFYGKHPELATDYNNTVQALKGRINVPQSAATPPHGQTVQQNGHTYTWDPVEAKYK